MHRIYEMSKKHDIRILLIGAAGQVGSELRRTLAPWGDLVATDRSTLELTDEAAIRRTVRDSHPELIVNAAAYTQVDPAEAEPDLAMKVNGRAPGIMAEEALRASAALIHYSTDYVFSASIQRPYREDDEPDPINTYGMTKLAGEKAIAAVGPPYLILRTSWVFGTGGKGFFNTIINLAREREELKVVDDQIGTPNWCQSIAEATAQIISGMSSRGVVDAITEVPRHLPFLRRAAHRQVRIRRGDPRTLSPPRRGARPAATAHQAPDPREQRGVPQRRAAPALLGAVAGKVITDLRRYPAELARATR